MTVDRGLQTVDSLFSATTRDGTSIAVDVVRISSGQPGPHLAVFAAMHGTEYASVAAMGRLIQTLDRARVRGTLTLIPVANRLAFESRTMYVPARWQEPESHVSRRSQRHVRRGAGRPAVAGSGQPGQPHPRRSWW
ncbi:MAG TPA: succinylglutamate desuccinylase/aspartoacylase family protein [Chloroflexota bacterium]|nr:succinylglutamate desuccinylase/aspartoacylase family protein [Chloroflexota bacterium]